MSEKRIEVVELPIDDLKPYERNPRVNDAAVDSVAASIKEFGFKVPIVVDSENVIVAGHTRWRAAHQLGLETVPCIVADDLNEEQIKAFRLADNKVAEKAEWDDALLELELFDITSIDMSEFGFEIDEVDDEKSVSESNKQFERMELKAFEHYDYVVFVFKNTMDWLNIVNKFEVKKVNAGYGKTKKVGIGRVIDGKRLLEVLQHPSSDSE